jgi:predicted secreted protein
LVVGEKGADERALSAEVVKNEDEAIDKRSTIVRQALDDYRLETT